MRALLAKLFPPRPILLTGQLLAPKPGQVLLLSTDQPLTRAQRETARAHLIAKFGSMNQIFVISGPAQLSVIDRDEGSQYAEGRHNEA